jgi:hypothetical protein
MWGKQRFNKQKRIARWGVVAATMLFAWFFLPVQASAITGIPTPAPGEGSYGLEATKSQPAPKTSASISTPGNGSAFSSSPITVSGICTKGLLVQVYDNGVLVGAIDCTTGSYSIQITLFSGENELSAIQYDDLGQASPVSNKVTVTYNNAHFSAFGALITLTTNYGRRAADPGSTLTWPLQLSGGSGPYAFSTDWGDGKPAQLKSQALAGAVNIDHVYDQSGVYHVTIKVTDANGISAFLQVVAVANGKPTAAGSTDKGTSSPPKAKIMMLPTIASIVLLAPAFWLGRRSELVSLHKRLEKDMSNYHEM